MCSGSALVYVLLSRFSFSITVFRKSLKKTFQDFPKDGIFQLFGKNVWEFVPGVGVPGKDGLGGVPGCGGWGGVPGKGGSEGFPGKGGSEGFPGKGGKGGVPGRGEVPGSGGRGGVPGKGGAPLGSGGSSAPISFLIQFKKCRTRTYTPYLCSTPHPSPQLVIPLTTHRLEGVEKHWKGPPESPPHASELPLAYPAQNMFHETCPL